MEVLVQKWSSEELDITILADAMKKVEKLHEIYCQSTT